MGMYNTLNGEQVKCFFVPCSSLQRNSCELNDVSLSFYTSGGSLNYYGTGNRVPYRTPFYNYGRNFVIYDYRLWNDCDVPEVIIIRDGKLYANIPYTQIQDADIEGIELFVNNFGSILNVSSAEDIRNITKECEEALKKYNELMEFYDKEYGSERVSHFSAFREEITNLPEEEFFRLIELHNKARDRAYDESLRIANNKWYSNDEEIELKVHGGYMFGVIYDNLSKSYMTEWEKHKVMECFKKHLEKNEKNYDEELSKYIKWVRNSGSKLTKKEICALFEKYSQAPTVEIIDEYKNSHSYQFYLKQHQRK